MRYKCCNCKKEIPEDSFDFMPRLQGNCCSTGCYNHYRDSLIKDSGRMEVKVIIKKILEIAENCVELNMDNYDESQVEEINNAMIEIHSLVKTD